MKSSTTKKLAWAWLRLRPNTNAATPVKTRFKIICHPSQECDTTRTTPERSWCRLCETTPSYGKYIDPHESPQVPNLTATPRAARKIRPPAPLICRQSDENLCITGCHASQVVSVPLPQTDYCTHKHSRYWSQKQTDCKIDSSASRCQPSRRSRSLHPVDFPSGQGSPNRRVQPQGQKNPEAAATATASGNFSSQRVNPSEEFIKPTYFAARLRRATTKPTTPRAAKAKVPGSGTFAK